MRNFVRLSRKIKHRCESQAAVIMHWHTSRFNCNSVTVDYVDVTGSRGVLLHVRTVRQCAWNCGKTRGVATVVNNHVTTAKYGSTTGDVASVFIINTSTYPCWNKIRRMFLLNLHGLITLCSTQTYPPVSSNVANKSHSLQVKSQIWNLSKTQNGLVHRLKYWLVGERHLGSLLYLCIYS